MATIVTQTSGVGFLSQAGFYRIASSYMIGANPPYTPAPGAENLSCVMELHEKIGMDYFLIARLQGRFNSMTKICQFVIRDLLRYQVELALPTTPSSLAGLTNALVKQIRASITERFSIPPEDEGFFHALEEQVIYGGARIAGAPAYLQDDFFVAHNYAIASAPRKHVHYQQPDWIYIFSPTNQTISRTVTIYLEGGTTVDYNLTDVSLTAYQHRYVAGGWTQLGLQALLDADLILEEAYAYEVKLFTVDKEFKVKYRLHRRQHDWNTWLLHTNFMGGLETMWLKGKKTTGFTSESEEVQIARDFFVDERYGDDVGINASLRDTWKINTGWQDRYTLDMIRQLHLHHCWLVEGGKFLRVKVAPGATDLYEDDQAQQSSVELELTAAYYDEYYNAMT